MAEPQSRTLAARPVSMAAPFPKGMWRRTYEELREQAFEAEMLADEAFAMRAERLLARIDNPKRHGNFWR